MRDRSATLWWFFGGLAWGAVIALSSAFPAGGGHGWVSALPFGILAIFTAPLVTVTWARRKTSGRKLAMIALGIALTADVLLLLATLNEGTEYFYKVFWIAIVWTLFWSSWQVLAIVVLLSEKSVN